MFEILEVKRKVRSPTPLDLLNMFYGQSSIIIKGKNGIWYEVEDGHGADLVWTECGETDDEVRALISSLSMENVTDIVIIKDAVEVWCDNECGDHDEE
jgi:hypothetical protein